MQDKIYLTVQDLMVRYAISRVTVWRWQNGENPGFPQPVKFGKRRLWDLKAIESWERVKVASGSQSNKVGEVA